MIYSFRPPISFFFSYPSPSSHFSPIFVFIIPHPFYISTSLLDSNFGVLSRSHRRERGRGHGHGHGYRVKENGVSIGLSFYFIPPPHFVLSFPSLHLIFFFLPLFLFFLPLISFFPPLLLHCWSRIEISPLVYNFE
ncbi:hypothetical protein L228DRAFT_54385 [Xylona heveae TC161]|uniref:Uncharacterized protein n=1 Tax=Xylona heveae (strain CBS 132557 / TC161) TaxID=1328760 RepID=A0A164Z9M2_XYLHT|nr:hypothetical protein L228DRAFT_54385 [Xylona heveae TC161]KZF18848.1 hypothetical protein L228DRAFT_54385 [Xylona heveae TC161]